MLVTFLKRVSTACTFFGARCYCFFKVRLHTNNYRTCMGMCLWNSCLRLCLHDNSTQVETNPGWDFSCVYKRQVGIKHVELNKPFSYHPHNFLKKDPAKYTTSLFNPSWTVYMHFSAFFNPGCHVNTRLLLRACRVETRHVNIAYLKRVKSTKSFNVNNIA